MMHEVKDNLFLLLGSTSSAEVIYLIANKNIPVGLCQTMLQCKHSANASLRSSFELCRAYIRILSGLVMVLGYLTDALSLFPVEILF